MGKPVIKIHFSDFWSDFDHKDNYFVRVLSKKYTIAFDRESPDFLFFSCYGNEYLKYKCLRVFYTPDNVRVDFSCCDFGIGFDYMQRENYFRLPLYVYYLNGDLQPLVKKDIDAPRILREKTGFCNMIVSNPNSKKRIQFFHKLSKYKKVDSGGRYLNNIGEPVKEKVPFIRNYKFTFAFENSSYPGYTTEKIMEPMVAHSMPIYYGNPLIAKEFNPGSFVNAHDFKSDEEVIDRIIELDQDDKKYLNCLEQPYVYNNDLNSLDFNPGQFETFLDKIVVASRQITPVARTNKKYIHEARRKFFILKHELGKRLGIHRQS
ncbi:MAG: glycosyltransferase family 10 domain-containing protein [Chitinophagales bacterium]